MGNNEDDVQWAIDTTIKMANAIHDRHVKRKIAEMEERFRQLQEQVKSAEMDAHPTYNDPIEVTLHLTREQGRLLHDIAVNTGGSPTDSRRGLMNDVLRQLEEQGYSGTGTPKDFEFTRTALYLKNKGAP